jgi:hypothetical protein
MRVQGADLWRRLAFPDHYSLASVLMNLSVTSLANVKAVIKK